MKRIILFISVMSGIILTSSCKKEKSKDSEIVHELPITFEKTKSPNQSSITIGNGDVVLSNAEVSNFEEEVGDLCSATGHGVSSGIGKSWDLATCKSDCSKGLGFRCGSDLYVICSDGARIYYGHSDGSCPSHTHVTTESSSQTMPTSYYEHRINNRVKQSRGMTALYKFYSNNTMKIIFTKALPKEENSTDTAFDIENEDYIPLPKHVKIGGIKYTSYTTIPGKYQLNKRDGANGSVSIKIRLNK
jgi:hypothetical protein